MEVVCGWVWIFSGIAQFVQKATIASYLKLVVMFCFSVILPLKEDFKAS